MSYKTLSFAVSALLAVLVLSSVASALTLSTPEQMSLGANQTTIQLSSGENVTITSLSFSPNPVIDGSTSVTFNLVSPSAPFNISGGTSKEVTLSVSNLVSPKIFEEYSTTLTASGTNNGTPVNATTPVSFMKGFCKSGPAGGNLTIDRVDVSSTGDEDNAWKPLDEITVEVRVANNGNNDMKEVYVELGLYDESGKNKIGDLEFTNNDSNSEKISLGTINDGDDKTATFEFKVPANFNFDAGSSYKLAVKAYSDKAGESKECVDSSDDLSNSLYEDITIDRQDDDGKYIAFDQISLTSDTATCGDKMTLDLKAYNVGDSDQSKVSVRLYNQALGIDSRYDIKGGLDQDENALVSFDFTVPSVNDAHYSLELTAYYEDGSSDNPTYVPLDVIGCSLVTPQQTVNIDAIPGQATAGKTLTVQATITNLASTAQTLIVGASGFDSWATLGSISNRLVTLQPGQSQPITVTLDVAKTASGAQSFSIEAVAGNQTTTQSVPVTVAASQFAFNFSNLFAGNGLIWTIALINIVLIVIIIIVAVKIARR